MALLTAGSQCVEQLSSTITRRRGSSVSASLGSSTFFNQWSTSIVPKYPLRTPVQGTKSWSIVYPASTLHVSPRAVAVVAVLRAYRSISAVSPACLFVEDRLIKEHKVLRVETASIYAPETTELGAAGVSYTVFLGL